MSCLQRTSHLTRAVARQLAPRATRSLSSRAPARSVDPFRRVFNEMFDSLEHDMLAPWGGPSRFPSISLPTRRSMLPSISSHGDFGMSLDLHETDKGFELSADLPGMRKEDIKVDVDSESGVLTVSGERKHEKEHKNGGEDKKKTYHFVERSYGKTIRSIRLPQEADASNAKATYADGVLKLQFPKREAPHSRRLEISVTDGATTDGAEKSPDVEDDGKVSIHEAGSATTGS